MRVQLKAGPAPIATTPSRDEPARTNGNGGSHGSNGEASAFRELLTEFRNLTERYGQALLALGEARGEVAGLRSRVELLEARLDLRLPVAADTTPISWEPSAGPLSPELRPPTPEPASVEAEAPAPVAARPAPRTSRPRKARSTRAAVAGFAQALARAQDPTVSDLADASPSPAAPAPAVAAAAESFVAIVPEPFELPEAPFEPGPEAEPEVAAEAGLESESEPEPLPASPTGPDDAQPVYSATVVEPDWFADGDFAWLDAADVEARATPAIEPQQAAEPVADAIPAPQVERSAEAPAEPDVEPTPPVAAEPAVESFVVPESYPEADWRGPSQVEPEAPIDSGPPPPSNPIRESDAIDQPFEAAQSAEPLQASAPVAVAVEEEVMWIGAERAAEMEIATRGRSDEPEPPIAQVDPLDTIVWPTTDSVPPPARPEPPLLSMTEEELARLARDEGWDEAEVEAIRAMIAPPAPRVGPLPGAAELDEAMAALRAVPLHGDQESAPVLEWTKSATGSDAPTRYDDWAFEVESRASLPQPQAPQRPAPFPAPSGAPRRLVDDPNWLRRRQGPAAAAYRRLRRLFPG